MINTISSKPFDTFGNKGPLAGEASEVDPYADLFAALFDTPVVAPLAPVTLPTASQNPTGDSVPDRILSETGKVASQVFMPKIGDVPSGNMPPSKIERRVGGGGSTQAGLGEMESTDLNSLFSAFETKFAPTNQEVPKGDLSGLKGEQWPGLDLPDARVHGKGSIDLSQLLLEPTDGSTAERISQAAGSDEQTLSPQVTQQSTERYQTPQTTIQPSEEVRVFEAQVLDLPAQAPVSAAKASFSHSLSSHSDIAAGVAQQKRSIEVSQLTTGAPPTTHFAPSPTPVAESKSFPKLFKDVLSVVKDDDSLRTSFQDDPLPDQSIVERIRQNFSSRGGQPFEQRPFELSGSARELDEFETRGEMSFDVTKGSAGTEPKALGALANETRMSEKVLHQIEPHLLDLIASDNSDAKKRGLKIRLTPADLGTVEITIERNAAGTINAHFRTETRSTSEILNETLVQLRDSLERSGLEVGDLDISCRTFSSGANDGRGERRQEFGIAEGQPVGSRTFDGISQNEDDEQNRLLNLRA